MTVLGWLNSKWIGINIVKKWVEQSAHETEEGSQCCTWRAFLCQQLLDWIEVNIDATIWIICAYQGWYQRIKDTYKVRAIHLASLLISFSSKSSGLDRPSYSQSWPEFIIWQLFLYFQILSLSFIETTIYHKYSNKSDVCKTYTYFSTSPIDTSDKEKHSIYCRQMLSLCGDYKNISRTAEMHKLSNNHFRIITGQKKHNYFLRENCGLSRLFNIWGKRQSWSLQKKKKFISRLVNLVLNKKKESFFLQFVTLSENNIHFEK